MTISQLIAKLQKMQANHGDITVYAEDEEYGDYEINGVVFKSAYKLKERWSGTEDEHYPDHVLLGDMWIEA